MMTENEPRYICHRHLPINKLIRKGSWLFFRGCYIVEVSIDPSPSHNMCNIDAQSGCMLMLQSSIGFVVTVYYGYGYEYE